MRPPAQAVSTANAARAILRATDGPVLLDTEGAYLFAGGPDWPRLRVYDAYETDVLDHLGLAPILESVMARDIRARRLARFVDSEVFVSRRLLDLLAIYYEPAEKAGRYTFYRPRPETAIVAVPVADRVARRDGGLTVQVVTARNVRQWGRYIQAAHPDAPLTLVYEATATAPLGRANVTYAPRLTAPGQTMTVTAEDEQGRELARSVHHVGDFANTGEGFANRVRLDFVPTGTFRVRFDLSPGAQLWLDPAHPLVFAAARP